jgi:predicted nucleic acid-binding protein
MSLYFLDTNVLIDLSSARKTRPFFERLLETGRLRLGTSLLCLAEYFAGAGPDEDRFLKNWIATGELEVFFLDSMEDAVHAAELRRKRSLLMPDALILASAVRHRAHLLTHDANLLRQASALIPSTDPFDES